MENARKLTIVPFNEDNIDPPKYNLNKTKKKSITQSDKVKRMIQVILKLAKIEGYDENGRIKAKNGIYLEKSNIINLLNYSMTIGSPLIGEYEFVELLKECKIDPNLIINEKIKSKLINDYDNTKITKIEPTVVIAKRKFEDMEEESNKKVKTNEIVSVDEDPPTSKEDIFDDYPVRKEPILKKHLNVPEKLNWEIPKRKFSKRYAPY